MFLAPEAATLPSSNPLKASWCGECVERACSRANTKKDPWLRHAGFLESLIGGRTNTWRAI